MSFFIIIVGASVTVIPPINIDLVGQDKLAVAFGWTNTFIGFQYFLTLPVAGKFVEHILYFIAYIGI